MLSPQELPLKLPSTPMAEVSLGIKPEIPAVGQGQPLTCSGNITIAGIGVPAIVVVRVVPAGYEFTPDIAFEQLAGFGFALPFTGAYSATVRTEDREYGTYKVQAVALAAPPSPPVPLGASSEISIGVEAPRIGAALVETAYAARKASPLIESPSLPKTIRCRIEYKNTGNIKHKFTLWASLAGTGLPTLCGSYTETVDTQPNEIKLFDGVILTIPAQDKAGNPIPDKSTWYGTAGVSEGYNKEACAPITPYAGKAQGEVFRYSVPPPPEVIGAELVSAIWYV